jgi:hypothetical protein
MKVSVLKQRLSYILQQSPITLYALVIILLTALGYYWLRHSILIEDKDALYSYRPILNIILKSTLGVLTILLAFSFLSVTVAWLYFIINKNNNTVQLDYDFNAGSANSTGNWIQAQLTKAYRPLLGAVGVRFLFKEGTRSDVMLFNSRMKKKGNPFISRGVALQQTLPWEDIKLYQITGLVVYFQDLFHLFSYPVTIKQPNQFQLLPHNIAVPLTSVPPLVTEQMEQRIDTPKKVEGEYLNYKKYESGDDVRRIVWKVYAKNRELMIRMPEVYNPYASHITLYASFYCEAPNTDIDLATTLLNRYKNQVWSLFQRLQEGAHEVRFISDQASQGQEQWSAAGAIQRIIAASAWQSVHDLQSYYTSNNTTVLCISSFNTPEEVETLLSNSNNKSTIYFSKLSLTFNSSIAKYWLSNLLLLSPKDKVKRLSGAWFISATKRTVLRQEAAIEQLLKQYNVPYFIH